MPEDLPEDTPEQPEDLNLPPSFFPYDDRSDLDEHHRAQGDPVEVQVEAVFAAQSGENIQRFVLLTDGHRKLPIVIGGFEAAAITLPLDGQQPDRPMTHDLIRVMLDRLETVVTRIVIDDLWGSTYYAKIYLDVKGTEIEIDSRPSDAIALAIRFDAPIFVIEGILDQVGQ